MVLLWLVCASVLSRQVAAVAVIGMLGLGERCGREVERSSGRFCGHGMICDATTDICKGTVMCAAERDRIRKETAAGVLADAQTPSCDKEGNYMGRQCYGGGVISEIRCQCVDRFTGKPLSACRQAVFASYQEVERSKMSCRCAQRQAEWRREHGAKVVGVTFNCDAITGDYQPVQCTGSVCRCVTPDGDRIGSYQFTVGQSDCKCARDLYECLKKNIRLPFCDDNGRYHKVLCFGGLCYCVDRTGGRVGEGVQAGSDRHRNLKC